MGATFHRIIKDFVIQVTVCCDYVSHQWFPSASISSLLREQM
jgi:hypothetical protein